MIKTPSDIYEIGACVAGFGTGYYFLRDALGMNKVIAELAGGIDNAGIRALINKYGEGIVYLILAFLVYTQLSGLLKWGIASSLVGCALASVTS